MPTMNFSLPDDMKAWIRQQVDDGRHSSYSHYIRWLIRRDQQRTGTLDELKRIVSDVTAVPPPDTANDAQAWEQVIAAILDLKRRAIGHPTGGDRHL